MRKIPSKYQIDLIAIVAPDIPVSFTAALESLGIIVQVRDLPVQYEEVPEGFVRESAKTTGCCGFGELLKLYGFLLTEYHRVEVMDPDMVMINNGDEILEAEESLLFTRGGSEPDGAFMGGWWTIKPNVTQFEEMVAIIRKGDWRSGNLVVRESNSFTLCDFYMLGTGWEGSGIGWIFGGMAIQGIVPFYFWKKCPRTFWRDLPGAIWDNYGEKSWANASRNVKISYYSETSFYQLAHNY